MRQPSLSLGTENGQSKGWAAGLAFKDLTLKSVQHPLQNRVSGLPSARADVPPAVIPADLRWHQLARLLEHTAGALTAIQPSSA